MSNYSFKVSLRNSASSFHWLSSSIFTVRWLLSRIGNTSSHLHYMMFQTIQTIYFLWGYDPGNMSVSFIVELSPVYCCLVMDVFYNFIIIPHQFTFWIEVKSLDIKTFSENTSDCQISPERRQTLRRPRRSFVGLILENLLLITVGQWPKVRGALRWALGCRGKETWSYFAFSHISYKCLHQSKFDTKLCNFKLIS